MKRIQVEPRTAEWHAYRAESWTASAAATLVASKNATLLRDYAASVGVTLDIEPLLKVGLDTFFENTLWTVWAEKMGRIPRFGGNEHTARGTENEDLVVKHFEIDQMFVVEPEVTALSSEYAGLLASFDAVAPQSTDPTVIAPYGFPVEAKCPAFPSRQKLWNAKKEGKLAILGLVYYWCQVQHQIYVAEAPYGWFVAAGVEEDETTKEMKVTFPIIEKVPRDEEFLKAYVAAAKFYHEHFIESYTEPPKLPSDELLLERLAEKAAFDRAIASDDHDLAVELYLNAVKEEASLKARREELEAKVLQAAAKMREEGVDVVMMADRLKVTYSTSSSTSWQKVAKELAKKAGMPDIPKDVLDACQSKAKESAKLKEVV